MKNRKRGVKPMKQIKFCHLSDPHLGKYARKNETRYNDYFESLQKALLQCMEYKPSFLLLTGDLFDHIEPGSGTINKFFEICDNLFDTFPNLPLFVIPGNHDFPKTQYRLKYGYVLQILNYSKFHKNLILIDDEVLLYQIPETDQKVIITGLRYRDDEPLYYLKELISEPENKQMFKENPDAPKILMMHQYTSGMQNLIDSAVQLNENELKQFNFDYIGIGHNHLFWKKPQLNIYCPGSTDHCSRSEWRQKERYIFQGKMVFDENNKNWKTTTKEISYVVRTKINEVLDLGHTTYEKAIEEIEKKVNEITKEESIVYLDVKGTFPTEETRFLDLRYIKNSVTNEKNPAEIDIVNSIYTESFEVSDTAETAQEILQELLEKKFNLEGKEKEAYSSMVNKIRDGEHQFNSPEEIEELIILFEENIPDRGV